MKRFPDFLSGARRVFRHAVVFAASTPFSGRAALTALCFFVIATAGMRQMDASYRQSIVKAGHYSLVETSARHWHARDLRVGWTKNGAYVGVVDYAMLEAFALGGYVLAFFTFMTPAAWSALALLRARSPGGAEENSPQEISGGVAPASGAILAAEGLPRS
jgi:hypothetical protein